MGAAQHANAFGGTQTGKGYCGGARLFLPASFNAWEEHHTVAQFSVEGQCLTH